MMRIAPARRIDVIEMEGEPFDEAMRGIAIYSEEEGLLGYAGVLHTNPLQAFSKMRDGLRKSPKTIVRAAKVFRDVLNKYDQEVIAIASEHEKNAPRFLEFIGFKYKLTNHLGRIYSWHG